MDQLLSFSRSFDQYVFVAILTIPRLYAFVNSSQLFSASAVPGITRIAVILSLAVLAIPVNLDLVESFDRSAVSFALVFAKEYAIGFVIGALVAWIFWVVESAGALVDNQRGASIASSMDPLLGHESSPIGNLLSLTFLTYIFSTGSILPILRIAYQSYLLWPTGNPLPSLSSEFPVLMLGILDQAMSLGFNLALPIVAVMFLAEFALAMVSRFAPQIQVFVLAMPIKSLLAIFMLIFYARVLFPFMDLQLPSLERLSGALYQSFEGSLTSGPAGPSP